MWRTFPTIEQCNNLFTTHISSSSLQTDKSNIAHQKLLCNYLTLKVNEEMTATRLHEGYVRLYSNIGVIF